MRKSQRNYAKDMPSRLRSYAKRRKMSTCRGLRSSNCSSNTKTCSYASGTIRKFCRRKNNTPHSMSRHYKTSKKQTQLRRSKRIQSKLHLRRSLRIQQRKN